MPILLYIYAYLTIGILTAAVITGTCDDHASTTKDFLYMFIGGILTWPFLILGFVLYLILSAGCGIFIWYRILKNAIVNTIKKGAKYGNTNS